MSGRAVRSLIVAGALIASGAASAQAQQRSWRSDRTPGWIGISFGAQTDRWGRVSDVVITDVVSGSPAERGGVRAGDILLAVNDLDTPDELALLSERLRLSAGDPVVMVVERNGERARVRLRAEERPEEYTVGSTVELTLMQSDSMVESWVRAIDSLRVELVAGGGNDVAVRRRVSSDARRRVSVVSEAEPRPVQAPFEFFVFRGEAHDSLRREMDEVNRMTADLERRVTDRERTLRRRRDRSDDDAELRGLRRSLEELSRRSARLEASMAEEARNTAGLDYVLPTPGVGSSVTPAVPTGSAEFRPLTPYLLGRNRVAGAEVVDLKPELAQYFQVSDGILVVDVASRTPAAIAGIQPGDVIVRIDAVRVRSVEDLRFGVSVAGDSLPITLIRQGSSVQVLLRR